MKNISYNVLIRDLNEWFENFNTTIRVKRSDVGSSIQLYTVDEFAGFLAHLSESGQKKIAEHIYNVVNELTGYEEKEIMIKWNNTKTIISLWYDGEPLLKEFKEE